MSFLALGVGWRSNISYRKTQDKALLYFSIAFISIGIYLGSLPVFLVLNLEPLIVGKLMSMTRMFIFVAVIFLFKTPIFKLTFLNSNAITYLLIVIALVVTGFRLLFPVEPTISEFGVIALNLPLWVGFLSGFPAMFVSVMWYWQYMKNLPERVSLVFKTRSYLLCIGGVMLGISDISYTLSQNIETSFLGSSIGVVGYVFVLVSIVMPSIRRYVTAKPELG
ncbi:hypothetical protein CL654_02415 [bacterium]|nr:hypothetical protein [bacterium]